MIQCGNVPAATLPDVTALDLLLRIVPATLLLAAAALLWRDGRRDAVAWYFAALALGLVGFLAGNTPDPALKPSGAAATAAGLLSGHAALALWWFCLAVFDDDFRPGALEVGVAAVWSAAVLLDRGVLGAAYADAGFVRVLLALGLGIVVHVCVRLLRDRDGDLVPPRRRARRVIVAALAGLLLVDLAVDLAFGVGWKPAWFTATQNAVIGVIAARVLWATASADAGVLTFRRPVPAARHAAATVALPAAALDAAATESPAKTPGDARMRQRLDALMHGEQLYRDPELTFAAFAARMGAPEPEVRRFINQRLGGRHFRSFVNGYRVAAARDALRDPARAGDKMIAIAFDAGFASLASFNRVFKQAEGVAPSDYRLHAAAPAAPARAASEGP